MTSYTKRTKQKDRLLDKERNKKSRHENPCEHVFHFGAPFRFCLLFTLHSFHHLLSLFLLLLIYFFIFLLISYYFQRIKLLMTIKVFVSTELVGSLKKIIKDLKNVPLSMEGNDTVAELVEKLRKSIKVPELECRVFIVEDENKIIASELMQLEADQHYVVECSKFFYISRAFLY